MATKHYFTSPVVKVALLLGAIFAIIFPALPVSAQDITFGCSFQTMVPDGSSVMDHLSMSASPGYYTRDSELVGLHFGDGQWAGLDITVATRSPFASGGVVSFVNKDSQDSKGGGWGIIIDGADNCSGWIAFSWHLPEPSGYNVGDQVDTTTILANPGCSGFENACGTSIPAHNHNGIGRYSETNPFPPNIPTFSIKFAGRTVWLIHPARLEGEAPQLRAQTSSSNSDSQFHLATQDLSKVPTPILVSVGLAVVFALALANRKTRGVAALSMTVILLAGVAYLVIFHRSEISWPRDPLKEITVATAAATPPPDGPCEISQKYPADIQRWCVLITGYAHVRGFDPNLIAAQILQESGGDPEILSHSGAVGLMQVMPNDGVAATFKNDKGEPYFADRPTIKQLKDPTFNVDYGTGMLEGLRNEFSVGYSQEQLADPAIQRTILREALKKYGPRDRGYEYADIVLSIWGNYK